MKVYIFIIHEKQLLDGFLVSVSNFILELPW